MLQNKKIIVGVCGGIAAYKTALLIRLLKKNGAEVKVVMTPASHEFITPLTLATLSDNPALTHFSDPKTGSWNNHVDLGLWADAMVVAPATASTLSKMAHGQSDNLLITTYLSARCPVWVAPAMDLDMYAHPTTHTTLNLLQQHGVQLIDAQEGALASGLSGKGRMAEPEDILQGLISHFSPQSVLKGKHLLITAGPTFEAIDPVRFIGNHSSGTMGYELAMAAQLRGAKVTLVLGPNELDTTNFTGNIERVTSANEMLITCKTLYPAQDIGIFAAAVADYTPKEVATQKIKKNDSTLSLELTKTPDIAKEMGVLKSSKQFNVGFALETEKEKEHAKGKLKRKNFDLIVLNSLNDAGAGFKHQTNKITIIDTQNKILEFELKSKKEVANDILNEIEKRM